MGERTDPRTCYHDVLDCEGEGVIDDLICASCGTNMRDLPGFLLNKCYTTDPEHGTWVRNRRMERAQARSALRKPKRGD